MTVIDADTHVDESDATWSYIQGEDAKFAPTEQVAKNFDPTRRGGRYWVFDGGIRQTRHARSDERTGTTQESRELLDVSARLRDMDEVGTAVHVMYPTMFLTEFTDRAEFELPVKRSYNRWIGERTGASKEARDRLRWVIIPPTLSMDATLEEMRWGKDHGAVGVLKKGDLEAGHWPTEEYFFPFYEEAERLGLTVCFHLGGGVPARTPSAQVPHVAFMLFKAPILNAFDSFLRDDIPNKFPKLRSAFVEAGSSWLPHVFDMMDRRSMKLAKDSAPGVRPPSNAELLRANRMYVTCLVDEDLPYLISCVGEDTLMAGSDYTHSDDSMERDFATTIRERAARGEISSSAAQKILWDNPKACYGL